MPIEPDIVTIGRAKNTFDIGAKWHMLQGQWNPTGIGKPGEPVNKSPHLGDLILQKYEGILHTGFEDLKRFELIDRLEKPVLDFIFLGNKKKILEVYEFLSGYPYACLP